MAESVREYLARIGKKGGDASTKRLNPAQLKLRARKAANARWAKHEKKLEKVVAQLTEGTTALLRKAKKKAKP